MNVLVAGGTGAVGTAIVQALEAHGHRPRSLGRHSGTHQLDITSAPMSELRSALDGCDAVVHAAGRLAGPPREMDRTNVLGTARLLEAAVGLVARFVFVSSTSRYGQLRDRLVDERATARPTNVYARTKALAEDDVLSIGRSGVLSTAVLQPSVVLGMLRPSPLARLFTVARRGLPLPQPHRLAVLNVVDAGAVGAATVRLVECRAESAYILSQPLEWSLIYREIESRVRHRVHRIPEPVAKLLPRLAGHVPRSSISGLGSASLWSTMEFSAERAAKDLGFRPLDPVDLIAQELR